MLHLQQGNEMTHFAKTALENPPQMDFNQMGVIVRP